VPKWEARIQVPSGCSASRSSGRHRTEGAERRPCVVWTGGAALGMKGNGAALDGREMARLWDARRRPCVGRRRGGCRAARGIPPRSRPGRASWHRAPALRSRGVGARGGWRIWRHGGSRAAGGLGLGTLVRVLIGESPTPSAPFSPSIHRGIFFRRFTTDFF
jgi:hypothetical protein